MMTNVMDPVALLYEAGVTDSGLYDLPPAAFDSGGGVARVDDQGGVIDDELVIIAAMVGADEDRVVAGQRLRR